LLKFFEQIFFPLILGCVPPESGSAVPASGGDVATPGADAEKPRKRFGEGLTGAPVFANIGRFPRAK
jgi:hypothetical protein